MTERIDHAKMAQVIRYNIHAEEMADPATANWLAIAQVHATLALVEQQRIANLLTYVALPMEIHGTQSDAWAEINDGLGLT